MSKNNKYWGRYQNEQSEWKSIKCSTYKKLKKINPTKWEHIKIYTRLIRGERYQLYSKANSNKFAYYPKQSPQKNTGGKMTTTHEFITEVISQLQELNIIVENKHIFIKPDSISVEEEKVEVYCRDQKKHFTYYPDLIVYFSNNKEYEEKWDGRFAIEINHTNKSNNTKRKHLQYIGLTLLELNVSKSIKFRYENKEIDESKIEEYEKYLKDIFSKKIYLNQGYKTYSNRFLGNSVYKYSKEVIKLKEALDKTKNDYKEALEYFDSTKQILNKRNTFLSSENKELKKEINKLKKMNLFKRIIFLFKPLTN